MAFLSNPRAVLGVVLLLMILSLASLGPALWTVDPTAQDFAAALTFPNIEHPFGTDSLGRDLFSRVMLGARTSLAVGGSAVLFALLIGVPLGVVSGYRLGVFDRIVMRGMDGLLSFPPILLAIVLVAALGPDVRNVTLALGIVYTPVFARLSRASTIAVKEEEFIVAAVTTGCSVSRIVTRHVFPNVTAPLIIQASANFSTAIISEASLSFLGLGTQPPYPSWGLDLNEGRRYLELAPWLALAPATAISLSVLAVNFLADGLREALDPRMRPM